MYSVGSFTTDTDGNTTPIELRVGTYYIKETKSPKGFQLDTKVHVITVKARETSVSKLRIHQRIQLL